MSSQFGPVAPCPTCGCVTQIVARPGRLPRREEVTTGRRHVCPAPVAPLTDHLECLCGAPIRLVGGARYAAASADRHTCRAYPDPTAPKPRRRPPPSETVPPPAAPPASVTRAPLRGVVRI